MSKLLTFVALKIFNGKIKSVVKKSGDEIEVTCTIEIGGVDFVGKSSKTGNSQQEIDAVKREATSEAHEMAFEKFVETHKHLIADNISADDALDRLVYSLH